MNLQASIITADRTFVWMKTALMFLMRRIGFYQSNVFLRFANRFSERIHLPATEFRGDKSVAMNQLARYSFGHELNRYEPGKIIFGFILFLLGLGNRLVYQKVPVEEVNKL